MQFSPSSPSPIYQIMINLIMYFPIWRHLSIFMNVVMWENCTFDCEIFDVAKFTILTLLSLLILCELSFPIVSLKISFLPTLALKSRNKIFIYYLGNLSNARSNSLQKVSFTSSILSSVGACRTSHH
jgi:hypothetical protein